MNVFLVSDLHFLPLYVMVVLYLSVSHSSELFILCHSGSGTGNIIEPISAVPLNDQLLEAKSSVADAEAEVLSEITEKVVRCYDFSYFVNFDDLSKF